MPHDTLKTAFYDPAQTPTEPDGLEEEGGYGEEGEGRYPRSYHILDFAFENLFSGAYAFPHVDKIKVAQDTADALCEGELQILEATTLKDYTENKASRAHTIPDPTYDFSFEFTGIETWSPLTVKLHLVSPTGEFIEKHEAHPLMRDAYDEFMHDMAITATNLDVKVNVDAGTIQGNSPMAFYRLIRDLLTWRNDEAEEVSEEVKKDTNDSDFPMESRAIPVPQFGYDHYLDPTTRTDDDRAAKATEGEEFLFDEDTEALALHNIPPRSYDSLTDIYLAAQITKTWLDFNEVMVRLDEMEAIMQAETNGQHSYTQNPLLNLH